jgi:hypothetical protein
MCQPHWNALFSRLLAKMGDLTLHDLYFSRSGMESGQELPLQAWGQEEWLNGRVMIIHAVCQSSRHSI